MGLVYFGVITGVLLALNSLLGYKGSFRRPTRPKLGGMAHAAR